MREAASEHTAYVHPLDKQGTAMLKKQMMAVLTMLVMAAAKGASATALASAQEVLQPMPPHQIRPDMRGESAGITEMPALLPGDWRSLNGDEARKAFFQLFLGMRSHFDLLGDIRQIRIMSLPFYTNATLVEARGWDTWGNPLVINVVVRPQDVVALDGTSIPIHEMNAVHVPTLASEEQAKAYLRFFTSAIQGKEGPFQIVEKISDIWWNRDEADAVRASAIADKLEPLKAHRDGYGGWNATATMVHSNGLFQIKLHVDPKGLVEMTEDQPLKAGLPIRVVRNSGVARQEHCSRQVCEQDLDVPAPLGEIAWATDQSNLLGMQQSLENNQNKLAAAYLAEQLQKIEGAVGLGYPSLHEKFIMLGYLYLAVNDFSSARDAFKGALAIYEASGIMDEETEARINNGMERAEAMLRTELIPASGNNKVLHP